MAGEKARPTPPLSSWSLYLMHPSCLKVTRDLEGAGIC